MDERLRPHERAEPLGRHNPSVDERRVVLAEQPLDELCGAEAAGSAYPAARLEFGWRYALRRVELERRRRACAV